MTKIPSKTYSPNHGQQFFKYAHLKRDGHFLNVIRTSSRPMVHCYTSAPKNIAADLTCHTQIMDLLHSMPMGTSLAGELYLPNHPASEVRTAINACNHNLKFAAFAVLGYDGYTPQQIERWPLEFAQKIVEEMGIEFIPYLTIPHKTPANRLLEDIRGDRPKDCEGYMLKNANLLDWHKLKWKNTIDLVITGITEGEGKYKGLLGSLVCSTSEGYEVANVSGMNDTMRLGMSREIDDLIGKVVEVEYQYVGAQGRLRHPVFLHLRPDKTKEQCSASQSPELEACWKKLTGQKQLF